MSAFLLAIVVVLAVVVPIAALGRKTLANIGRLLLLIAGLLVLLVALLFFRR